MRTIGSENRYSIGHWIESYTSLILKLPRQNKLERMSLVEKNKLRLMFANRAGCYTLSRKFQLDLAHYFC